MLISEDIAIDLCSVVMQYQEHLLASQSTFLHSFEPGVAKVHARLINDFWTADHFKGKRVLDIGSGLFPFSILARELGAEVIAIEFDNALAEVGQALGFEVYTDNLDMLPSGKFVGFDGVFLKGSFNPCRQRLDTIAEATQRITSVIKSDGWGWIVNSVHPRRNLKERRRIPFRRTVGARKANDERFQNFFTYLFGSEVQEIGTYKEYSMVKSLSLIETLTEEQKRQFQHFGWAVETPTDYECRRYALTYQRRPYIFSKNLKALVEVRGR